MTGRWEDRDGYRHPSHDPRYREAWRRFRRFVLSDEPLCRRCKRAGQVLDHIKPLKDFASVTHEELFCRDNIQVLCTPCHNAKTADDNRCGPRFCICGDPYEDGRPTCGESACEGRDDSAPQGPPPIRPLWADG